MPAPGTGLRIPETTRAKRPAKANRRVPETKCTHETRRLAGQLPSLRNAWFEWECVVVDAACIEPVSTSKFPGNREINSEFRGTRPSGGDSGAQSASQLNRLPPEFPAQRGREFSKPYQGKFFGEQGIAVGVLARAAHSSCSRHVPSWSDRQTRKRSFEPHSDPSSPIAARHAFTTWSPLGRIVRASSPCHRVRAL